MVRMAGLEEKMLGWPEFRNPRDRYAYSSPEAIGEIIPEIIPGVRDHLHRWDDPVEISSGPYIPSEDDSKIVPLAETDIGQLYGKSEIPSYMDPTTGDIEVAGLFDQIKSGGSGGKLPTTKNKAGVLDATYVKTGVMTRQEFMDLFPIYP